MFSVPVARGHTRSGFFLFKPMDATPLTPNMVSISKAQTDSSADSSAKDSCVDSSDESVKRPSKTKAVASNTKGLDVLVKVIHY